MLLSFAEFEREVIGEQVRDKIAASKRKGLWVGGPVPLGYRCIDKKLVVVPEEAEVVRTGAGAGLIGACTRQSAVTASSSPTDSLLLFGPERSASAPCGSASASAARTARARSCPLSGRLSPW